MMSFGITMFQPLDVTFSVREQGQDTRPEHCSARAFARDSQRCTRCRHSHPGTTFLRPHHPPRHYGCRYYFCSYRSKRYATLLEKASFVSGRDGPSIDALSGILRESKDPVIQPDGVVLVRDPVLSNKMFSDVEGKCWKQSEGEDRSVQ